MCLIKTKNIESVHPLIYSDIVVDSCLEMKGPRPCDLPKHCAHGEHGRVRYSGEVAGLTFLEANKKNVLRHWVLPSGESLALLNKMRPHCLFDLLLIDSSNNPASVFTNQSEEYRSLYWQIVYKLVVLLSDKSRLERYGMNPYFTHITYNVDSDVLDRESSTSDTRFHTHFNTFCKSELARIKPIKLDSIHDAYTRICLVDPVLLMGVDIIRDALSGLFSEEIMDSGLAQSVIIKQKLPLGFIFELKNGWESLNSTVFPRFLSDVHQHLTNAFKDLRFAFHGKTQPPAVWQRHSLLAIDEISYNLGQLQWLSPHSSRSLQSLAKKLKNLSAYKIASLKKHPQLLERHLSIAGLSYSVSLISPTLSSANSPLISSREVIGYIQPKLFCSFGGAGQPFIPGTNVVQLKKCAAPYTEEEFLIRQAFQKEIAEELM